MESTHDFQIWKQTFFPEYYSPHNKGVVVSFGCFSFRETNLIFEPWTDKCHKWIKPISLKKLATYLRPSSYETKIYFSYVKQIETNWEKITPAQK